MEVTLKLKHYHIRSADKPPFDSFTGGIEQMVVLKQGTPSPPSPFHTQLKKGPTRPSHAELQDAADTFNPVPQAFKPNITPTTMPTPSAAKNSPSNNVLGASYGNRPTTTYSMMQKTTVGEGEPQVGDKRHTDDDGDQGTKKAKKGKAKVSINTKLCHIFASNCLYRRINNYPPRHTINTYTYKSLFKIQK